MNELSIITTPTELTPIPEFKNPALTAAAHRLDEIRVDAASRVSAAVRETATLFATIAERELYKDDGFKSVSEFGEKIFHYGKSMVSLYVNAGRVYNNDESPAFLKTLSPFSLQEIKNIPTDTIMDAVKSGELSSTPTQAALRKFAQDYKAENAEPKVVDTYQVEYRLFSNNTVRYPEAITIPEFFEFAKAKLGNAAIEIPAPPVEIYKIGKDGKPTVDKNGKHRTIKFPRKIYLSPDTNDTLVAIFTPYTPPKTKKTDNTTSPDTAILDKAIELHKQGLIDDNVFKAMTGKDADEYFGINPNDLDWNDSE